MSNPAGVACGRMCHMTEGGQRGTGRRTGSTSRRWARVALGLGVAGVLGGCAGATGAGSQAQEANRVVTTVSDAISYPHQRDAAGLARAAGSTQAGRDGRLEVIRARDLHGASLNDPQAELLFRVHLQSTGQGFSGAPAFTGCYRVTFDYYGALGGPVGVSCPG
jgi:hypothetical protein